MNLAEFYQLPGEPGIGPGTHCEDRVHAQHSEPLQFILWGNFVTVDVARSRSGSVVSRWTVRHGHYGG